MKLHLTDVRAFYATPGKHVKLRSTDHRVNRYIARIHNVIHDTDDLLRQPVIQLLAPDKSTRPPVHAPKVNQE